MAKKKEVEQDDLHARWCEEIKLYEREADRWHSRGKNIVKRYKDERDANYEQSTRFNILWSNIQTLMPAVYARDPKPQIERRNKDKDPIGREASEVLERCTTYQIEQYGFGAMMKQAVLDRLLPGRGTLWVRYIPQFRDMQLTGTEEVQEEGAQLTDDAEGREPSESGEDEPIQTIEYEYVQCDYVNWEDFGHTIARTWEECRAVWRKTYKSRKELVERFGDIGENVPLDYSPDDKAQKTREDMKKAVVYEIWDKDEKKAIWLCKGYPKVLEVRDDPLGLENFFPCARPLFATLGNDSLIPVPDYREYEDQARELDELTQRISSLTKSIKVVGVYDASAPALANLLNSGTENTLVAVSTWAMFAEKGGLKGAVDFLPVRDVVEALLQLYQAREAVKRDLYEITGLADIIRGASQASETATAQRIKGQFASMRLSDIQDDVARFARDTIKIVAEIIAGRFQIQTLQQISGVNLPTQAEKEQIQMQLMMQGQNPQFQVPPEAQERLNMPSWEDIDALLKNTPARSFRIDIETDSTIKADEEQDKQERMEFITAVGGFINQALPLVQQAPQTAQAVGETIMFGIRGFRKGRQLEQAWADVIDKLTQMPPQQNPEQMQQIQEAQQQADEAAKNAQAEQQALEQSKAAMEVQQAQMEADMTKQMAQLEVRKQQLQALEQKLQHAVQMATETVVSASEGFTLKTNGQAGEQNAAVLAGVQQALNAIAETQQMLIASQNQPRMVVRDQMGRVSGIAPVQ